MASIHIHIVTILLLFATTCHAVDSEDVSLHDFRVPDVVVAADGTGNFTRVIDALLSAPIRSKIRYVIHVKKGIYNEHVIVLEEKWNIVMVGDGMDATIITGSLSVKHDHLSTPETATFTVSGNGFIAQDMSFENTAGALNGQAVALYSTSDKSVFYRCGISGYQDSLLADSGRQYYRECRIRGSADYIFGRAAVVFQYCQILVKKGSTNQNPITAQGGPHDKQTTFGFTFQFCNISADLDLIPFLNSTRSYLGRPWMNYSKVIFMECHISEVIDGEGWLKWGGTDQAQDTLYYAEYKNYGLGAGVKNRVKWPGYHALIYPKQALNFTVAHLISGYYWLPSTGVPFTPYFGSGK
ncbi:probable pectinesterase/pectinesterase inhibitor 44 [Vicia villosa]|uniref:probable pectinesterase/pectinesterase inhibitor 44 n=1 Tax=Vicia villosa TaxID=3911 RepID=UPI00273B378D|nr:probable pectinesterase/pectinesterase inhibitor 44 [Vicia villosa]XP_058750184.1 probable pectinesterase/pectinesterase inhibitor 44 [Vicia villosa]XP_058750196.1 probable pectinesterase/pectinesterase inhibitor 44 [Vicia villosa]